MPPDINPLKSNQVCKLKKSLCGLKQASKKWYEKLISTLLNHGYIQASVDHFLFIKKETMSFTLLLACIDNIIIAGISLAEFDNQNSLASLIQNPKLGTTEILP